MERRSGMAKRSAFRFAGARPIVVRSSARPSIIKVSAPRPLVGRARRVASRFASHAITAAKEEKHRLTACVAAGLVGYAEKEGWNIPHIDALGVPATWGLAGWLALKAGVVKSKTLSHSVTGLLAVASYKFGAGDTVLKLK
jgi:hypothetical protein